MAKSFRVNLFCVFLMTASILILGLDAYAASPDIPAADLVKDAVHNDLSDRGRPDVWLYHVEHTQAAHTESRLQADTMFGPIYRVLARDGVPLTPDQQRVEDARINSLLGNRSLQKKNRQTQLDDEKHLVDFMVLMPQAFLYQYDGEDNGNARMKFRPNPDFSPPTYEARAYHSLAGTIEINTQQKRIARMAGTLEQPVEFGFGILGKLEQGGTFEFRRVDTTDQRWKTSYVELHIQGHIAIFKSVAKDQKEVRSDFHQLPPETTLQQARNLLYK